MPAADTPSSGTSRLNDTIAPSSSILDCLESLDEKQDLDSLLSLSISKPTTRPCSPPRPARSTAIRNNGQCIASTSYLQPGSYFEGQQIFQTTASPPPPPSAMMTIDLPNSNPVYRALLGSLVGQEGASRVLNNPNRSPLQFPRELVMAATHSPNPAHAEMVRVMRAMLERSSTAATLPSASSETAKKTDNWAVRVFIRNVDMQKGTVDGFMQAMNVPKNSDVKILTYFEGEIIDGRNHSLFRSPTTVMSASEVAKQKILDQKYWSQLPSFNGVDVEAVKEGGYNSGMFGYVLMRWKEKAFMADPPTVFSLTIEGQYFVSLSRRTGAIEGQYCDPTKEPQNAQRLVLNPLKSDSGCDMACEHTVV